MGPAAIRSGAPHRGRSERLNFILLFYRIIPSDLFFSDEDFARLSLPARDTYLRSEFLADALGRLDGNQKYLWKSLWPKNDIPFRRFMQWSDEILASAGSWWVPYRDTAGHPFLFLPRVYVLRPKGIAVSRLPESNAALNLEGIPAYLAALAAMLDSGLHRRDDGARDNGRGSEGQSASARTPQIQVPSLSQEDMLLHAPSAERIVEYYYAKTNCPHRKRAANGLRCAAALLMAGHSEDALLAAVNSYASSMADWSKENRKKVCAPDTFFSDKWESYAFGRTASRSQPEPADAPQAQRRQAKEAKLAAMMAGAGTGGAACN